MYIYNQVILGVPVTKDQFFVKSGQKPQCGHHTVIPMKKKKFCADCGKPAKLKEVFVPTEKFTDWCKKSGISVSDAWAPDDTLPDQLAVFQIDSIYDIERKGDGRMAFGFCVYYCVGSDEGYCKVGWNSLNRLHEYKTKLFLALTELGLPGELALYPTVMVSY